MTSLVSDFLINPVLRQARRFSSGFATEAPDSPAHGTLRPATAAAASRTRVEEAISESEEDGIVSSAGDPAHPSLIDIPPAAASQVQDDGEQLAGDEVRDAVPQPADLNLESDQDTANQSEASGAATVAWSSKHAPVLPEDDGMGVLRQRILTIQSRDIPAEQKAVLMHHLLLEGYTKSQLTFQAKRALLPESRSSQAPLEEQSRLPAALQNLWNSISDNAGPLDIPLTEEDLRPSYAPEPSDDFVERHEHVEGGRRLLGCEHYRRNVKLQCVVCERWYPCRLCHDEAESHILPRYATRNMLCMLCGCAQRASDACIKCGESAAYYYCGICKLWNDDPNKSIYHCNDCGICRIGQGIGKDFFHCTVSIPPAPWNRPQSVREARDEADEMTRNAPPVFPSP